MMKVSWARDNYWKKRNCVYYEKQLSQSRRKALWGIGAGKTAEHDRVGLSPHTACKQEQNGAGLSPDRLATCLLVFTLLIKASRGKRGKMVDVSEKEKLAEGDKKKKNKLLEEYEQTTGNFCL
ncbi:uncharacterized protein AAEQ78_007570 [Lycaon pictus]